MPYIFNKRSNIIEKYRASISKINIISTSLLIYIRK